MDIQWVKGGCAGPPEPSLDGVNALESLPKAKLIQIARERGLKFDGLRKEELVTLLATSPEDEEEEEIIP